MYPKRRRRRRRYSIKHMGRNRRFRARDQRKLFTLDTQRHRRHLKFLCNTLADPHPILIEWAVVMAVGGLMGE